jgi:hypothetical protein
MVGGLASILQIQRKKKNGKINNMKVEKLTEEYSLIEQEGVYTLNFGTTKHNVPIYTKIRFSDIDSTFNLSVTCGCTATTKEIIDNSTTDYTIKYNAASLGKFEKTLVITSKGKRKELKLIGTTV